MRCRTFISFLCIVILLPYVVTVFVNGTQMKQQPAVYVNYKKNEEQNELMKRSKLETILNFFNY